MARPKKPTGTAEITDAGRAALADAPITPAASLVIRDTPPVHPLDDAAPGSLIFGTPEGALLATPERVDFLPPGDPAHKLPPGAEIKKTKDGIVARQRQFPAPPKTYASAHDAITDFLAHFHEVRD